MSLKKRMLTIAAVTAVTAATAMPAMALENEFHGLYRLRGFVSNFDDSASGAVAIGAQPGATVVSGKTYKNPPTYSYIEQRARLMYIAKANEDLRLVTHFEFDSRFGDTSYNANAVNSSNQGTTRNGGGGIGADQTNLETKNIFLEFRIPSTPVKVKAGIQGYTDNYKGIIFNNDAAGVTASSKIGDLTIMGGYFRFDDAITGGTNPSTSYLNYPISTAGTTVENPTVGFATRDFMTVGAKYNVSKNLVVGADYHLLYSDLLRHTQEKTYVNTVGANAEAKLGPATINGFVLYQFGQLGDAGLHAHQDLSAFAGNLAAKMPIGPGTAHITALVLTGDNNTGATGGERNDFQTIMERGATTSGHTFYEANSQLLLRNIYASDKTDRAVVFDLNNNGRGIVTAFAGYDLPIGKFFMNSNVGIGAVERDNGNANNGGVGAGPSNVLGTEINTEIGYKLYDNMTASVQAAYLFLGDFYKVSGSTPDNPYTTKVMLNYTF
jgi:hypothetical protein